VKTSVLPETVVTTQRSDAPSGAATRRTLNWCPHCVFRLATFTLDVHWRAVWTL
jgi:hypothetical protein